MAVGLILLPLLLAALAWALPSDRWRPWVLPPAGLAHLALTLGALWRPGAVAAGPWLDLDPPGRVVLLVVSVLFFFTAWYTAGYLRYRTERSNRVFTACLLLFLGAMSWVILAQHLGLMWVAMEATTLVSAPLIYFNRNPRSIEATWKYLLVCSVGIAVALLGSFFLAYAAVVGGGGTSLLFSSLLAEAPGLSRPWFNAGFVLLLVGYGTKMGLAPLHTWKPDAYGEAPGVVGALLAGGLTNCAFLAILRIYHIGLAAGSGAYLGPLLVATGLVSMGVAAVFMVGQRDFKRMLAYSSVEHMGLLALGLGLGGAATFGAMLHLVNNGLTKGVLFLSAGNIHRAFGSKTTPAVTGALQRLPLSGWLFVGGFLAITGSPPFGPFLSELTILSAAFAGGRFLAGGLVLLFLLVVFFGMGATVLAVAQGQAPADAGRTPYRDGLLTVLPILALLGLELLLGLYLPAPLEGVLRDATRFLEGTP